MTQVLQFTQNPLFAKHENIHSSPLSSTPTLSKQQPRIPPSQPSHRTPPCSPRHKISPAQPSNRINKPPGPNSPLILTSREVHPANKPPPAIEASETFSPVSPRRVAPPNEPCLPRRLSRNSPPADSSLHSQPRDLVLSLAARCGPLLAEPLLI